MDIEKRNKELIIRYYNGISGVLKTDALCRQFVDDPRLISNIQFWDGVFPKYELFADEIIAEGNRVVVRALMTGRHEGVLKGIPPTYRNVSLPFVIGYLVEKERIVDHWLFADQILLLEQLGIERPLVNQ